MFISLPHGIEISSDGKVATIKCDEMEPICPACESPFCFPHCDLNQEELDEQEQENLDKLTANCRLDGMTSLLLALHEQGVNVDTPEFKQAIITAADYIGNRF